MITMFFIMLSAALVNNVVLSCFLGICPYIGVSKKTETAVGMGMATTFVMTFSAAICYALEMLVLRPFDISYMQTLLFILVSASLVQILELVLKKTSPSLYTSLGIFLPLITTNCAVLGTILLAIQKEYSFFEAAFFAFCSGLGFVLAIVIFASIREKLSESPIPNAFKNVPIAFLTAAILSLAFMGFSGLVK